MSENILIQNYESILNLIWISLSIAGGVFGGLPRILSWIKKPRFELKDLDVDIQKDKIYFTISNNRFKRFFGRAVTDLTITCSVVNSETNVAMGGTFDIDNSNADIYYGGLGTPKIMVGNLPLGASTVLLNYLLDEIPTKFKFTIHLTSKEVDTIIEGKYPIKSN